MGDPKFLEMAAFLETVNENIDSTIDILSSGVDACMTYPLDDKSVFSVLLSSKYIVDTMEYLQMLQESNEAEIDDLIAKYILG